MSRSLFHYQRWAKITKLRSSQSVLLSYRDRTPSTIRGIVESISACRATSPGAGASFSGSLHRSTQKFAGVPKAERKYRARTYLSEPGKDEAGFVDKELRDV